MCPTLPPPVWRYTPCYRYPSKTPEVYTIMQTFSHQHFWIAFQVVNGERTDGAEQDFGNRTTPFPDVIRTESFRAVLQMVIVERRMSIAIVSTVTTTVSTLPIVIAGGLNCWEGLENVWKIINWGAHNKLGWVEKSDEKNHIYPKSAWIWKN